MSETETKETPRSDAARSDGDSAAPQSNNESGTPQPQQGGGAQQQRRDDRRGPRGRNRHRGGGGGQQQQGGQNRGVDSDEEFVEIEGPNKGVVIDLNELKRKPAHLLL